MLKNSRILAIAAVAAGRLPQGGCHRPRSSGDANALSKLHLRGGETTWPASEIAVPPGEFTRSQCMYRYLVWDQSIEPIAQAIHERWRSEQIGAGKPAPSWEELDESRKESSRDNARDIPSNSAWSAAISHRCASRAHRISPSPMPKSKHFGRRTPPLDA